MRKLSILLLVLVAIFASCKKTPEVNLKYVDVERDLITVGATTATVQCDYDYIATLKKAYFYYGEGENEADMNAAEMRVVQNTLYVDLAGLKENTSYSYYYEFHNGFNSMRTAVKTFKTEGGSGPMVILPTVVTAAVTEITTNSAQGGGEVTNDGGAEVTERGICWSTNANPTLSDSHVAAGTGTGTFTAMMNGLEASTTYHVRAYATNSAGTAYGLDREFVTIEGGGGGVPEGAINGLFTINENGDQVYFSQGNLQYQASTNTWRFAEHQWDYVGGIDDMGIEYGNVYEAGVKSDNRMISSTYNGWIDMFCWGTSGWDNGNTYYHPWDYEVDNLPNHGFGYGPTDGSNYLFELTGDYANADWGVYNAISNGGNTINMWRTPTRNEWKFLFDIRFTKLDIRYAKAIVNNINGVILLPDNWNGFYHLQEVNNSTVSYSTNTISASDWSLLEDAGVVFFPAAGGRGGTNVFEEGTTFCNYWSASTFYASGADCFGFGVGHIFPDGNILRTYGYVVRLIQDANK